MVMPAEAGGVLSLELACVTYWDRGDMCKNLDSDSDLQKGLNFNSVFTTGYLKFWEKWLFTCWMAAPGAFTKMFY